MGKRVDNRGGLLGDQRWEASLNEQRTCCDWTLFAAGPSRDVIARGTITFEAEKYRPHVSSGHLVAADQQELLISILDAIPELRDLK